MKLGVNIDHVATLRNARGGFEPDPVRAALICQKAGANSIVMHLREDRRHVTDRDLFRVQDAIRIRLNMEMSIAPDILKAATRLKPHQSTLVPEKRTERTTEGGLDLKKNPVSIERAIEILKRKKIEISLFIDPDLKQVELAKKYGADAVEFHTGDYANQKSEPGRNREWVKLRNAVLVARQLSLKAHAGHGLDFENVGALKKIRGIEELNIGYSIITRSLWAGLDDSVREMIRIIS